MTFKQVMQQHLHEMQVRAKNLRATQYEIAIKADVTEKEAAELKLTLDRWERETAP